MKVYIILFASFLLSIQSSITAQSCEEEFGGDLSENLLLHYKLDGDAIDISSNGFDAAVIDISSSIDRNGFSDKSVRLNNESIIILPEDDILEPDYPFAVSCWSKIENSFEQNVLFASDFEENDYNGAWIFVVPDGRVSIGIGNGNGSTGPGNRRSYVSSDKINNNQWNHVVALFNGPEDFKIFINGCESEVTGSGSGSFDISYTENSGVIGLLDVATDPNSGLYYFEGSLDDFYFWDRAITEEEVLYLYDNFNVPNILNQDEFTLDGVNPVLVGANPALSDVMWSDGTTGNIVSIMEAGKYAVEGYHNCILVCDSFIVNEVVIEPEVCDTIVPVITGCKHGNYECVLDQSNGGLKYFYEGHLLLEDGTELCNSTELEASFNHGEIEIVNFENHNHTDGTRWISYSAYLYIENAELYENENSYISFDLCMDSEESDFCVSYFLPYKECYSDYQCNVINKGVTASSDEAYVDVNYCLDLHEVEQDDCHVSEYEIEAVIYGSYYSKTVSNQTLEGDFSTARCITVPILVTDFLSMNYNCVELFISGDCPGISCAHLDCEVFYRPTGMVSSDISSISVNDIVAHSKENSNTNKIEIDSDGIILDSSDAASFKVFPVPTKDIVNVEFSGFNSEENYRLVFTNTLGQVVNVVEMLGDHTIVDISSLYEGIYYLSVYENHKQLNVKKIIKL